MNQVLSSLTFRFLLGLVMAETIFISLLNLSQDLNVYLSRVENGGFFQVASFFLLFFVSSIGLYLLMKNKRVNAELIEDDMTSFIAFDYKTIGFKFIEGFVRGLACERNHQQRKR